MRRDRNNLQITKTYLSVSRINRMIIVSGESRDISMEPFGRKAIHSIISTTMAQRVSFNVHKSI